tara:strand:- start:289 stop:612 length:324 start_codon:yes stop_codon:yes gene_type:complete
MDEAVPRKVRALWAAIAEHLDSQGVMFSEYYMEVGRFFPEAGNWTFDESEWGAIFYEGTNAARFFSLDAAYITGAASDYSDYDEMLNTLNEHGVYSEQDCARAQIYG